MKPLRLLAVVLVCTCSSQAGTVTGTVEGTANISIAQVVAVQGPQPPTVYNDVPSVLTYTYDIGNSVNFSITNSVYSFDTASLVGVTDPESYGFSSYESLELMTLISSTYHIYFLSAYLELTGGILTSAGYQYSPTNELGNGETILTNFTPTDPPGDPPAVSVPEPSSIAMMAIAFMYIYFVRSRRCVTS